LATIAPPGQSVRKFYGWNNAALVFLIQFTYSGFVFFAYSTIFPAMVEAMDWNRGSASIAHSLSYLMLGIFYPLTAWLIGKYGVRFTYSSGLLVMLAGLLMIIFLVSEVWHWTIAWGVVMGIAFALTGPIVGHTLTIYWFNARRATVLGIVVTGGAVGGFFAQPILAYVIERFDTWQSGWVVSIFVVLIALARTHFLINKPSEIDQHPDGIDPNLSNDSSLNATIKPLTYRSTHNWSMREVFNNHAVYLILIIGATYLGVGTFFLAHGALHLNDIGISKLETATLMGVFIFGSGAGRIPAGWLGDKIELRWLVAAIMGLLMVAFIIFAATENFTILAISGFVIGLCYGGKFALAPAMISNYFGEESFAKINSLFAPVLLPFVAIAPVGAGYIFDAQGSYDLAFTIGTGLLGVSVLAAIILKPPVPKLPQA